MAGRRISGWRNEDESHNTKLSLGLLIPPTLSLCKALLYCEHKFSVAHPLQFRRAPGAALHLRPFSTTVSEQQHTLCSSPSLAIVWFSMHWFTWLYFLHRIQCVLTSERDVGLAGRSISGWRNEDELNEDELNICRVE